MTTDGDLVPSFIPALVVLLTHHERAKGAPLTREEVEALRDDATCIMVERAHEAALAASRGYDDLDPERAWEQWQVARLEIGTLDPPAGAEPGPTS